MPRVLKKHPLAIRWFHWLNFPVIALMVWSGTLILWANDTYATQLYQAGYRLTHGGKESENPPRWLKVPDRIVLSPVRRVVYSGDELPESFPPEGQRTELVPGFRLAEGMAWHFALAWVFALNGLVYVAFLALSGQWRHLLPHRDSLRGAVRVALRELAFWKHPVVGGEGGAKYNEAQRIAYTGVVLLGALMVATGLAISKPVQLAWLSVPFGGYQGARLVHFVVTCLLVAFFFVHVTQVVRAGWNAFRAMLTGWEVVAAPTALPAAVPPQEPDEALAEEEEEPSPPETALEEVTETP